MGLKKRKKRIVEAVRIRNIDLNAEGRRPENYLIDWQMDRLAEECSELIQAVMKVKRYPNNEERLRNLHEELSHVNICSSIVMALIGDKEEYDSEMDKKLSQLERTYVEEIVTIDARKD